MTIQEMRAAVEEVAFPDYEFMVGESRQGFLYLQAEYDEADTITGMVERQHTRRWALSPEMSKSEIVSTAFKCALTSMEHKTREWFTYRGRAIYQPHYDVDTLHSVCEGRLEREQVADITQEEKA
jgi:hypothetical protein